MNSGHTALIWDCHNGFFAVSVASLGMLIATFVISMDGVRPVGDPDRKINVDGEINPVAYAYRISALRPSDGLKLIWEKR